MKINFLYSILGVIGIVSLLLLQNALSLTPIERDMANGKFTGESDEIATVVDSAGNDYAVPLYTVKMNTNTNNISLHRYSSPFIPAMSYKADSIVFFGSNKQIAGAYKNGTMIASITKTPPYRAVWRGVKFKNSGKSSSKKNKSQ